MDGDWRSRKTSAKWRGECRNGKMSDVITGSSGPLAKFGYWVTLSSLAREARGAGGKSGCQGAVGSMCLEEVGDGDF